eukprot:1764271-Pyramimonas_sp.AAC.1
MAWLLHVGPDLGRRARVHFFLRIFTAERQPEIFDKRLGSPESQFILGHGERPQLAGEGEEPQHAG